MEMDSCIAGDSLVSQFHRSFPHGSCFKCTIMLSYSNQTTLSPEGQGEDPRSKSYGYIIATGVVLMAIMVIVALVFVYRMYRKRSGPLWITKFYVQDPYCSMTNDESSPKDDHFILGFSNPIMESAADLGDHQDGIKVLGYKPLDTEKQPEGKEHEQYKFLFPRERLVFGPEIGSGWFGQVYEGEGLRIVPGLRKTKVIIKKLKEDSTYQLRRRFIQETDTLRCLEHKNVLGIIGKATEKQPFLVLFERSPMGNLKEFLLSHKHDAESLKTKGVPLTMAIDIAAGLHYLHSNAFFHSDLAARNCVVDGDLSVKIGDYGISRYLYENDYHQDPSSNNESVPIRWLDPDSVSFLKDNGLTVQPPTATNNVWSYGVTVWEIIEFGRQPYEELTDKEVIQSVLIDQLYQLPEPKETGILANQLYETMRWCWIEASRRPSIQDIMTYLTEFKENFSNIMEDELPRNESKDEANDNNAVEHSEQHDWQMKEADTKTYVEEMTDDIEITEICDSDSIPVTVINSIAQEVQDDIITENKQEDEDRESCVIPGTSNVSQTPPPVTYIGDPSEGLAEYERRLADGTQEVIDPLTAGNEIVEVKYAGSDPSVVVENCASGYVVLPGELVRRKSSLRRENAKSRGQSVHFPANILDLRVVHRYYKEEEEEEEEEEEGEQEEEDGHVLSHDVITDHHSRPDDLLIQAGQDILTTNSLERPMSPVEKKIKKASRRKKLDRQSDEWLFSIEH